MKNAFCFWRIFAVDRRTLPSQLHFVQNQADSILQAWHAASAQLCESRPIIYPSCFPKYPRAAMSISIKTPEEIEKMRVAGCLAGEVLDYIAPFVKAGVTTDELDKLCHDYMVNVQGCIPAPLNYAPSGYNPYPKSICTSVNQQVCHGVPGRTHSEKRRHHQSRHYNDQEWLSR